MWAKLTQLDGKGSPGQVYNLDELSQRHTDPHVVRIEGLLFEWNRQASAWFVQNTESSDSTWITTKVTRLRLDQGVRRRLPPSCHIKWETVTFWFENQAEPPTLNGSEAAKFDIGKEGLIIGRGEESKDGVSAPRICLDNEAVLISRMQARIEFDGDRYVVVNLFDRKRTMINGNGSFDRQALVFGDCIQMPEFEYYTFQFNGKSLIHVGNRGILQARELRRVAGGRPILADASLDLDGADFVGVLGGSGQGKSTLMNALCGMVPADSGEVRVDGKLLCGAKDMPKAGIGYVPQDDIVHRELTVRQALTYGARLRLALPKRQLDDAVDGTLRTLGLEEHQRKPVNVLSGGQRKRVSIASELITNPSFLFLDEPTSGLDPGTEAELMAELYSLKNNKRMGILCTTHVLESSFFLSAIAFVQRGRIIFQGSPKNAARYLLGSRNIDAVVTDHTASNSGSSSGESSNEILRQLPLVFKKLQEDVQQRIEEIEAKGASANSQAGETAPEQVAREKEKEFRESGFAIPLIPVYKTDKPKPSAHELIPRPGFASVIWTLLARQWAILLSDPLNYLFLLAQAVVIGCLVGWVSDNLVFQMFIAVIATLWFGCSNAAQQIVGELAIFKRENLSGVGLNAYLMSKFVFLTAVTSSQAIILYFAILCTHHLFHHEVLPTAEKYDPTVERLAFAQLFFDDDPEYLRPPPPAPAPPPAPPAGSVGQTASAPAAPSSAATKQSDDFDLSTPTPTPAADSTPVPTPAADAPPQPTPAETPTPAPPAATDPPVDETPQITHVNPSGLTAVSPQFAILERLAWFFRVKENMADELGVREVDTQPGEWQPPIPHESWISFLAVLIGLRIGVLLTAACTGVGIGLLVSACVRTVTQAVMWVPLILIPQILFGGFVVTTPEMDPPVAIFSSLLPSYNLQRLMDVTNLLGCTTPRMTNKTKIPAFFSAPPYDNEAVRWTSPDNGLEEEQYDKVAEKNKSWQNLLVWSKKIGMRYKQGDVESVETRRDVLADSGDRPNFMAFAAPSWMILGGWVVGCYAAVIVLLMRKQRGK